MRRDARDCATPLTATVLPVPQQKPKTVSGGWARPAGRPAGGRGGDSTGKTHLCRLDWTTCTPRFVGEIGTGMDHLRAITIVGGAHQGRSLYGDAAVSEARNQLDI
eukprot:COSAG02_NODE_2389_length_8985_cov_3.175676_5_plen_106_part_00